MHEKTKGWKITLKNNKIKEANVHWKFNPIGATKDYKGGYRLASKIKDEVYEADLYTKHLCTCSLCTVQYRHTVG